MQAELRSEAWSSKDFWKVVGVADAQLALDLHGQGLQARPKRLADLYLAAFSDRSTVRERSSPVEHLQSLAALHPEPSQAAALRWIIDQLTGTTSDNGG